MALGKQELIVLSDEVWERTRDRLAGLTDDEYFWEPAPGCWSIRRRGDGRWASDGARPGPHPEPFTTIAWRLWHLIDMYGEDRAPNWLDVPAQGDAIGLDAPDPTPPATAADALEALDRAHRRWDAHLDLVTEEQLEQPIGRVGGPYGDRSRTSYVLHMLDEFIHHAAEISLLRDLWRWQHPLDPDPLIERVRRGDLTLLDEIGPDTPTELLATAASYGWWDLVAGMVAAGVSPNTSGRTPLHGAAIAGELDLVQLLVMHGADVGARDPEFDAPPLEWARFGRQTAVVEWLAEHAD